jgi:hypothetical protein
MDVLMTDVMQDPGYKLISVTVWVRFLMLPYLPILKNEKQK